jgi:hypothetical protein
VDEEVVIGKGCTVGAPHTEEAAEKKIAVIGKGSIVKDGETVEAGTEVKA